jgi:hypothetical protein
MDDIWMRVMENMSFRIDGPMKFRFVLQPVMAMIFAFIAGRKDALAGKPPYFWTLLTAPEHRIDMLKDGWKSVGKVFMLAMVLDVVFQVIALKTVYPGEVVIVAFLLAIVPYLIVRGLVTRLMRKP